MRWPKTKEEKLKVVIGVGILAPAVARFLFPGVELAQSVAAQLTTVTTLMWLMEN